MLRIPIPPSDLKYSHHKKGTKQNVTINFDFGHFLGHILGDGSMNHRDFNIEYCNRELCNIKCFEKSLKKVFGPIYLHRNIWIGEDGKNTIKVRTPSFVGRWLLRNHLYMRKNKRIPNLVMLNKEALHGLLQAYFDDDGSPYFNSKNKIREITAEDENIQLLKDIQSALLHFNISSKLMKGRSKKTMKLRISRQKNILNFYKHIGFANKRKIKILEEMINYKLRRMRSNGLNQQLILRELEKCPKTVKELAIKLDIHKSNVFRYLKLLERKGMVKIDAIRKRGQVVWRRV